MKNSSKIYVFCIIDSNNINSISLPCGFENNSIYCIPLNDIGIVVCNFSDKISDVKRGVLLHENIIELLMSSFTVLPMKFQTAFSSHEKTLSELFKLYNNFKENLVRLTDKFEFGIKVLWPVDNIEENLLKNIKATETSVISGISPAKDYLRKRYMNYRIKEMLKQKAKILVDEMDEYFTDIAIEKKLKILQTDKLLVNAACLVDKTQKDKIHIIFKRLKKDFNDLEFLFSGPWPPYNFIKKKRTED